MLEDYFTQDLKEGEEVVVILRKHWASFLWPILKTFIILVIPFFLVFFLFSTLWGMIVFFVWISIGFAYGLHKWITWYFDSFVITNWRIVNIDQRGLLSRSVSETSFRNIQDVTYEIHGLMPTAFNYGSVKVQTASSDGSLMISSIPEPKSVQDLILELQAKSGSKGGEKMSASELISFINKAKDEDQTGDAKDNREEEGIDEEKNYPSF